MKIIIVLEGGLVQEVLTSTDADVAVIDYDTEGAEDEDLTAIPQGDGTSQEAYCHLPTPTVIPDRIDELYKSVSDGEEVKAEKFSERNPGLRADDLDIKELEFEED